MMESEVYELVQLLRPHSMRWCFVETMIRKAESLLESFKEPFKQVHRGAWHFCVGAKVGCREISLLGI
jgi:hypothetical protein